MAAPARMTQGRAMERTFRMPRKDLLNAYCLFAVTGAFAAVAAAGLGWVTPREATQAIALVVTALLLVYPVFSRRVWVTVSSRGIQGRTFLGIRRRLVRWTHPVEVRPYEPSEGPRGIALFLLRPDGRPRLLHAAFIPEPILRSSEFQAALTAFAPSGHPLRPRR
jgi:hypothetical protein